MYRRTFCVKIIICIKEMNNVQNNSLIYVNMHNKMYRNYIFNLYHKNKLQKLSCFIDKMTIKSFLFFYVTIFFPTVFSS